MNKLLAAGAAVAAVASGIAIAAPASAAPSNEGAACAQAGLATLKSLGLLEAAAAKQIDYSMLADTENGPIFADLPAESYLSLGQVVAVLHEPRTVRLVLLTLRA